MKNALKRACLIIGWLYAGLIIIWFILQVWIGDGVWWLALGGSFTPLLFLPLIVLLPTCLICRWRPFWLSVVPPVAIFLILYGTLFLPRLRPASVEAPMVVMTFNIWGYSESVETARAIVYDEVPDVLALQELSPEMATVVVEELGDIYPYREFVFGTDPDSGVGVLSHYPVQQVASQVSGWRVQALRVVVGERSFTLYNIHPAVSNVLAYLEDGDSLAEGMEASWREREAQIRELVADIESRDEPVIVAGDLNSTDQSTVYRLLDGELSDAHRVSGWGLGHTFPAYGGSWRGIPIIARQMRIDMVFYSDEFVALSCSVGSAHGESDHLPVLAELAWRE